MRPSPRFRFAPLVLAAFQFCAALVLLRWALPLFFDPPILGNGVDAATYDLRRLVERAGSPPHVASAVELLPWLFARQTEGVVVALLAAGALATSAVFGVLSAKPGRER